MKEEVLSIKKNKPLDLIKLMRPQQWIKNAFVFAGILFGNEFTNIPLLITVIIAAASFSLVSSSIYILNDIIDCESDKHHPKKKKRPIACGSVTISTAAILGVIVGSAGLVLGWLASLKVLTIVILYLILNITYSLRLKNIVILDVFCISAGFMLRLLAGTVGVGIPPSKWLLLCGLMITLFLGFAKRRAEIIALQAQKQEHRKVLVNYGPVLLDEIIAICATGVIISYSLYTMSADTVRIHRTESLIYTVPFVIYALFRYIYLLHHGNSGGDPSRDLLKDTHIIICVFGWALMTIFLFARSYLQALL